MFSFFLSQQKYFYNKQTEMCLMYMYSTKYDMHYMYIVFRTWQKCLQTIYEETSISDSTQKYSDNEKYVNQGNFFAQSHTKFFCSISSMLNEKERNSWKKVGEKNYCTFLTPDIGEKDRETMAAAVEHANPANVLLV